MSGVLPRVYNKFITHDAYDPDTGVISIMRVVGKTAFSLVE